MMNFIRRRATPADQLGLGLLAAAAVVALIRGSLRSIAAGAAFVLMMLGALPRMPALAFLVGATVILLLQTRGGAEGFEDAKKEEKATEEKKEEEKPAEEKPAEEKPANEEPKTAEAFAGGKKPMLPDNATRREPLVLGKPYTLPSETDDKDVHLDAGTTFLNAYKALKPDQIAAMTRDTQELLATQKSLVSMLDSFGPLMKDMGKLTGFLNSK